MLDIDQRDLQGYGANPRKVVWPSNAMLAISFVINYEEGGEYSPWCGDEQTEVFLNETPGTIAWRGGTRNPNMESQYEYGSRCGVWRMLRLFDSFGVKFTCYAVGKAVECNPEAVAAMELSGHEIASHNYHWIEYSDVDEPTFKSHVKQCIKAISTASPSGSAPVGWYTGRIGPHNRKWVHEVYSELGLPLLYDSDAYNDDLPYYTLINATPHLVLPYTLDVNDMKYCVPPGFTSPNEWADYAISAITELIYEAEQTGTPKMLSIGLHCRLTGRPGRIGALRKVLCFCQEQGEKLWLARRRDIAQVWRQQVPPLEEGRQ